VAVGAVRETLPVSANARARVLFLVVPTVRNAGMGPGVGAGETADYNIY